MLIFCLVRLEESGLVAQWESVRLTRGRSLVRNQPGPPRLNSHFGPPQALADFPCPVSVTRSRTLAVTVIEERPIVFCRHFRSAPSNS